MTIRKTIMAGVSNIWKASMFVLARRAASGRISLAYCLLGAFSASAGILYVDVNSPGPVVPFTNWSTAASNIQDAIDSATNGDLILVTNGTYQTGGRPASPGVHTNRVAVTKPVTIQSVNGPAVTIIQGYQMPVVIFGDDAVRCAYLADGAALIGFTLTNGATRVYGDPRDTGGAGVYCQSSNAALSNCVLTGNSAYSGGGGAMRGSFYDCTFTGNSAGFGGAAYGATIRNCALTFNSADYGGGAGDSTLQNCTVTGNNANLSGGGIFDGTLNNCIVFYNTALEGPNYSVGNSNFLVMNYCCTTPLPAGGAGNIATEPQLASFTHIGVGSPCRAAGSAAHSTGTDIDGEAWANPPSMGCDEHNPGAVTGPITVAIQAPFTKVATGFVLHFKAQIEGRLDESDWDFGDGTRATNRAYISHAWASPGDYSVALRASNESNPGGIAATTTVHVVSKQTHHVDVGSTNPTQPYGAWAVAATNIQDAIDAANPGDLVLVSNGVYQSGGRAVFGTMTNRVAVSLPVTVQSVNGPEVTIIKGFQVPVTTNDEGSIRCVYLTNDAALIGFTLTEGATHRVIANSGDFDNPRRYNGAGVWCESVQAIISNCVLKGNSAWLSGGGAYRGILNQCTISGNSTRFEYGGGAALSALNNCVVSGNVGISVWGGGGAAFCTLRNCTVTGNSGGAGGGVWGCFLDNCIAYYNSQNYSESTFNHCCTTPDPGAGTGNITDPPLFVDFAGGNLRLQSNSACLDAGDNGQVTSVSDRDGRPRIVGGTVDLGAYEYQGSELGLFIPWLQQNGIASDGSADFADTDTDGMNNWQEWRAGTTPTNASSLLLMLNPISSNSNIIVTWQSVTNRTYFLQRSSNLTGAFLPLASNLVGQAGTTSHTDASVAAPGLYFYRVGVQ